MTKWCVVPIATGIAACIACAQPQTDIVATSTESTGEYQIVAAEPGARLSIRACLASNADPDRVGARIVQQLVNHGYTAIGLELIRPSDGMRGEITRMTWSRDGSLRAEGSSSSDRNPCLGREPHGTSI